MKKFSFLEEHDCPITKPDGKYCLSADLWETLHPGSWDRNEWVWRYELERVK